MTRRIAVVTVGRSDYGIIRPLLRQIAAAQGFELNLIVGGAHLSRNHGSTINEIVADGFPIAARAEVDSVADTPCAIAHAMGQNTTAFAVAFENIQPDMIIVLGDRFEMHAACVAAVPFLIPVAHIAGGCLTHGAIDDAFRHSMTKLCALHFTETEAHAQRIRQLGADPAQVHVPGALNLDNLQSFERLSAGDIESSLGISLDEPPLLVTFHPETRDYENTERHIHELLAALANANRPTVFTYPNADTASQTIIDAIEAYAATHKSSWAIPHLGTQAYFSLMHHAAAMVGNSSSGIIEAASFRLPVVNVGTRQEGRLAPSNVLPVPCARRPILDAIHLATKPAHRSRLRNLKNPYGDGHAAERILSVLHAVDPEDPELRCPRFHDLPGQQSITDSPATTPRPANLNALSGNS